MEKKKYIKPEIEVVEMMTDVIMTGGSLIFNDKEVDTENQLSNGYRPRRGKWGDLWYVEEQ